MSSTPDFQAAMQHAQQSKLQRQQLEQEMQQLQEQRWTAVGQAPDPPSGQEAFQQVAIAWLLQRDIRAFLHPAVQKSVAEAYAGEHMEKAPDRPLDFATALLPRAFFHNYDRYNLLLWNSNLEARIKMLQDYPALPLPGGPWTIEDLPPDAARDIQQFTEHREHLPVILRGRARDIVEAARSKIKS